MRGTKQEMFEKICYSVYWSQIPLGSKRDSRGDKAEEMIIQFCSCLLTYFFLGVCVCVCVWLFAWNVGPVHMGLKTGNCALRVNVHLF